jgi:hypothetical protein
MMRIAIVFAAMLALSVLADAQRPTPRTPAKDFRQSKARAEKGG